MAGSKIAPVTAVPDMSVVLSNDVHRENAEARIRQSGAGAELLRQMYVGRVRFYMEAFYEHGSLADVVALSQALELSEQISPDCAPRKAPLMESLLGMLGVDAQMALSRKP